MIDHVTLTVRDLGVSKVFYETVLGALGMRVNLGSTEDQFWGFGSGDVPEFEVSLGRFFVAQADATHPIAPSVHIAFRARNQDEVKAFHRAALAAGGVDNGAPGPRPEYGETYYAAFVLDPDGNNIEAVTFE